MSDAVRWLDSAAQDAVNLFWQRCGEVEPFPRNLERPVALALPVAVVKLPRLRLRDVEAWLRRRGRPFQFSEHSRPLRGCLLAFGGQGLIFVDGADPDDERRFTLAHEVAHFMVDYWQPREKARQRFGEAITEALDGHRPLSVGERIHALLTGISIGVYTDLMERNEASGGMNLHVWQIENRADQVALALLAPPEAVLAEADMSAWRFEDRQRAMTALLCGRFGLPLAAAQSYSARLLSALGKGRSWLESMGLRRAEGELR